MASTSDGGLIVAGTIGRGAISTSFDLGRHTKIRFTISPTRRMRLTLTGRVIDAFLNRIDVKTSALIKK